LKLSSSNSREYQRENLEKTQACIKASPKILPRTMAGNTVGKDASVNGRTRDASVSLSDDEFKLYNHLAELMDQYVRLPTKCRTCSLAITEARY
jgi:hypothetical protein